jgi:hypothetical protein
MKQLILPNPPWGVRPPRPPAVDPPPLVNEVQRARTVTADELGAEAYALLDPELVEAAAAAYAASQAAARDNNAAVAELRELEAAEADTDDVDEAAIAARIARKMVLDRQIPALERRAARIDAECNRAITAVRQALARSPILQRERERRAALLRDAAELEQRAEEQRLTVMQLETVLGRWLPNT